MKISHAFSKRKKELFLPGRAVYVMALDIDKIEPAELRDARRGKETDIRTAAQQEAEGSATVGNLFLRFLTRNPDAQGTIQSREEVVHLVRTIKGHKSSAVTSAEPDSGEEHGNGITRRGFNIGTVAAGVSAFIVTLLGPWKEVMAEEGLTLQEFEQKLRALVMEFIAGNQEMVAHVLTPDIPDGNTTEHDFSAEDLEKVKEDLGHHGALRKRKNIFDDAEAQEGKEGLTFAGDIIGTATFAEAILLWVQGKHISTRHYVQILAACGMKYVGGTDAKKHHLQEEWITSMISFAAMMALGSIFKGEYFKGLDMKNYDYEELSFAMAGISHIVAPVNTTFGASVIMSPVLRELRGRWDAQLRPILETQLEKLKESGATDEEIEAAKENGEARLLKKLDNKTYNLFVHTSNTAGILGIGDYPFLRVVQELGLSNLLKWQIGDVAGPNSLVDKWIASYLYNIYQMAPLTMYPWQKLSWSIKVMLDKKNWQAGREFLSHLVPANSCSGDVLKPAKVAWEALKSDIPEVREKGLAAIKSGELVKGLKELQSTPRLIIDWATGVKNAIWNEMLEPAREDVRASLSLVFKDIMLGGGAELCRKSLMEVFQPQDFFRSFEDVFNGTGGELISDEAKERAWKEIKEKAKAYDEENNCYAEKDFTLREIVVDAQSTEEMIVLETAEISYHEYLRECMNALEAEAIKREGEATRANPNDLESISIDLIRNAVFKEVIKSKEFWTNFKHKVDHHHESRENIAKFIDSLTTDSVSEDKVHEIINKMVSGTIQMSDETMEQIADAIREGRVAIPAQEASQFISKAVSEKYLNADTEYIAKPIATVLAMKYFLDPHYMAHRLAPFIGTTLADMAGVLPMQIGAIVPVVDCLTRVEVMLPGIEASLGKVRARAYYAALVTYILSALAENYTGFSIGCGTIRKLLAPLINENPHKIALDDPRMTRFFRTLYFCSIIAAYADLLGDFGPHMALVSQVEDKNRGFPGIWESTKANWLQDILGASYMGYNLEQAITHFETEVMGGESSEGEHSEEVGFKDMPVEAQAEAVIKMLQQKHKGEEMPARARQLLDLLQNFIERQDDTMDAKAFDEHLQKVEELETASHGGMNKEAASAVGGVAPITTHATPTQPLKERQSAPAGH